MLRELPFYDELNIVKTSKACTKLQRGILRFKRYINPLDD